MAGNTSEILAKLGIDVKDIPGDLQQAEEFFRQFGQKAQGSLEKAGEEGGKGLVKGLTKNLGSGDAGRTIATALGLNVQVISNALAEAFAGGTKEALAEIGKIADARAKLREEALKDGRTSEEQLAAIDRDIARAEARIAKLSEKKTVQLQDVDTETGRSRTYDQEVPQTLKEETELQQKLLELETLKLDRAKTIKDVKKDQQEIAKAELELDHTGLDNQEKMVALQHELTDLLEKNSQDGVSAKEHEELALKIITKRKEIEEQIKTIQDEQDKNWETRKQYLDDEIARKEKIRDLTKDTKDLEDKISKQKSKLTDPSKLTLGELANINPLQFGISSDVGDKSAQAREIFDTEKKANEARLSGDVAGSADLLQKAQDMRKQLGQSGLLKSDQFGQNDEVVKSIDKLNTELGEKLDKLNEITSGIFKNQ